MSRITNPPFALYTKGCFSIILICFSLFSHSITKEENEAYHRASSLVSEHQYKEALKSLQIVSTKIPQVLYLKGQILIALNNLEKAESNFNELETVKGWSEIAWYYLALIYEKRGSTDQATLLLSKIQKSSAPISLKNKSEALLGQINSQAYDGSGFEISSQIGADFLYNDAELEDIQTNHFNDTGYTLQINTSIARGSNELNVSYYKRRQIDQNLFDFEQIGLGVSYSVFNVPLSTHYSVISTPTSKYDQILLSSQKNYSNYSLRKITYYLAFYDGKQDYDFLDGQRYGVNVLGQFNQALYWQYLIYKDERADNVANDYSPLSNKVVLNWFLKQAEQSFNLSSWYEYQTWLSND
ncbi:MAG: hypothetical protein R3321_12855, partial [Nitrososphaeraceae archaeon]|nr:hypothetical protein [Nitrososphaeraceae archaeon]